MIAVGVDTHKQRHYAVALDSLGQLLGELSFAASAAGYAELQRWAEALDEQQRLVFGIEGAGSWGAGLCEHLQGAGHRVVEVERPRRRERRAGKSDRVDALAAAKCALGDENTSTPRSGGVLAALRALLVARRSTVAERTRVLNQLQALNATAPVALRERVGEGTGKQLERRVLSMRPRARADVEERAVYARCNGTAPLPASSGKTIRHRLNRGGDRQVNNAIHTIALIRAKHQPDTRAYSTAASAKARPSAKPCAHSNATSSATSSNDSPTSP
jgi:Transposase/Transposase IS116/IS110/IS902 family